MAAYPTVTSVLQGGSVNQVLANGFLISGAQPSLNNYAGLTNVQLNETTAVAIPNEYGVTNVGDRVLIKYPVLGLPSISSVNYFKQNGNFLSTANINANNIVVHDNTQTAFVSGSSNFNPMTGNKCDNQASRLKGGRKNVHQEEKKKSINTYSHKGSCTKGQIIRTVTVPDPTQVKLNGDKRNKLGNLRIHMSESFLPGTIVSCKGILDLSFMRNLFEVTNVDINFVNNIPFEPGICNALKQIIHNNLLQDWLMLKCEEKQIQFFLVKDQIQIYSVNSFMAVLGTVAQESSLPLPFITKDAKNNTKYYYINFEKGANDKVKKLNSLIFYDADNGRKKVPCRYPGIRLDCNFETSVAGFTIHVHESAMTVYKNSISYIRQLLIYSHIVWGFLQAWILNVREHYNNCFTAADISRNLILNQTSEMNALTGNDDGMMYFIGYSNFYLKFDPVTLKETKTTFSIENFETSFACDVSIVQYYRQFILINDLHYSDALKNIILFSKKNEKSYDKATESTFLPRKTNISFKADCFQPTLSSQERQIFQPKVVSHAFTNAQNASSKEEGNGGGIDLQVQSDTRRSRPGLESNCTYTGHTVNVGNQSERPQVTVDLAKPGLKKPLIKTRTVNEINSLLENPDGIGFHRVSFHAEKTTEPKMPERKEISASDLAVKIDQILNRCYATNTLTVTNEDESQNPTLIQERFDEAVNKAIGLVTLESFIEKIYVELLFSFTNKTAQNILNRFIGRAIGMKYPLLKGKFLNCFENIRKESGKTGETRAGKLISTSMDHKEKVKKIFMLVSKDTAKPNFVVNHSLINRRETPVQISMPTNLAAVAPIVSRQQNTRGTEIRQSKTIGESSLTQKNLSDRVNISNKLSPNEPSESQNISACRQQQLNLSSSSFQMKNSNKNNQVLASDQSNKNMCIVDFNVNTHTENKAVRNVPDQVPVGPVTFRRSEEPKMATVNPSVVQNLANGSLPNISTSFPLNSQCQDKSRELINAPTPPDTLSQLETSGDIEKATNDEIRTSDSCQESQDTVYDFYQSDDSDKDSTPMTKEKYFDQYKLKHCSVVLNADDVNNYFALREKESEVDYSSDVSNDSNFVFYRRKCRKTDSLSEDPDFYLSLSRKGVKRRKGVSDLEYMEARTRVLQRLRKRSEMYVGKTRNSKMTSDELDNFLVRRNSYLGKSPYVEYSTDDEDATDQEIQTERVEESGSGRKEQLKKEIKIILVRLEDTPEYEKYKKCLESENQKSGMIRMGEKTETYYEHILNKKKQYFELKEGKLYLKEQYCVQDGVIVPADIGEKNSDTIRFKNEPHSPGNDENFSTVIIKEENTLD